MLSDKILQRYVNYVFDGSLANFPILSLPSGVFPLGLLLRASESKQIVITAFFAIGILSKS